MLKNKEDTFIPMIPHQGDLLLPFESLLRVFNANEERITKCFSKEVRFTPDNPQQTGNNKKLKLKISLPSREGVIKVTLPQEAKSIEVLPEETGFKEKLERLAKLDLYLGRFGIYDCDYNKMPSNHVVCMMKNDLKIPVNDAKRWIEIILKAGRNICTTKNNP